MTYQAKTYPTTLLRGSHIDYNPVTDQYEPFIVLESQHFSQLLGGRQSLLETDPLYGSVRLNVVSTTEAAPDGTATAARVAAISTNDHYIEVGNINNASLGGSPVTAWPGGRRAVRTFVKPGSITAVQLGFNTDTQYKFDLATGAPDGGNPDDKYRIRPAQGGAPLGWWEIYTVNYLNAASAQSFAIKMVKNGSKDFVAAADDADYFYLWTTLVEIGTSTPQNIGEFSGLDFPGGNGGCNGSDLPVLPLPAELEAPAEMTIYMEWLDRANGLKETAPGIFRLGDLPATGDGINVTQTSVGFTGVLTLGGLTSISNVALVPDVGELVSLRAIVSATGTLTMYASINNAAEVVGTTGDAVGLVGDWSDLILTPNSIGSTLFGDMMLRGLLAQPGSLTRAACQALME